MELLYKGARELGISLTDQQLGQFETYYRQLTDWNQRVNLTAITEYDEVQVKHFLDSLTVLLSVDPSQFTESRVIDVGAGAGLPGLPLKIAFPDVQLTFIDSVRKKTRFLEHLVKALGLTGVEICTGRAEDLAREPGLREGFDLALARGVAKLPVLAEYTLPFCKIGGKVVAWKHGGIEKELAEAEGAVRVLGGRLAGVHNVQTAGLTDDRVLVVLDKLVPTGDEYPRRVGLPAKQPLTA